MSIDLRKGLGRGYPYSNPSTKFKHNLLKRAKGADLCMSLLAYINEHPDERFWQALRNWSGFAFIMAISWSGANASDQVIVHNHDTFHWEGRDG